MDIDYKCECEHGICRDCEKFGGIFLNLTFSLTHARGKKINSIEGGIGVSYGTHGLSIKEMLY